MKLGGNRPLGDNPLLFKAITLYLNIILHIELNVGMFYIKTYEIFFPQMSMVLEESFL